MTKLIGAIAPGGGPAVQLADVLAALTTGEKAALLTALQQGSANGLPGPLDGSGKLPTAQLPALAVNEVYTVASQAAMLALSANVGDVAVRTDLSPHETFMLAAAPASTLGNWVQVTADSGAAAIAEAYTDTAIAGLAGVYVPRFASAPDHTIYPAYVDTSTVPPVLKGWNGTAWVAIGGGGITATDNNDGTITITAGGSGSFIDNNDGTLTLT